jgi:hypothetical protein
MVTGTVYAMTGYRNLIINGNPFINQRAYVSGSPLGSGYKYCLDRWRIVNGSQSISWSDSGYVRTVTAPSGGVQQVIEGRNILGGDYVLNWEGTAAATVNGYSTAKGAVFTLPAGTDAVIAFAGGSFAKAQLESGQFPTNFEHRNFTLELAMCQRYYLRLDRISLVRYDNSGLSYFGGLTNVVFPVTMRAAPTVTRTLLNGNFNDVVIASTVSGCAVYFNSGTTLGDYADYFLACESEL